MLHIIYKIFGHIFCFLILLYCIIRDKIHKPKEQAILFVAHPDDDTLFFHSFIKENKPYVVCLFTGWSIKRLIDFYKVMHYYGVNARIYNNISLNAYNSSIRRKITEIIIKNCYNLNKFKLCATHNNTGEYGHSTHKLVHESVLKMINNNCKITSPVDKEEIIHYPINTKLLVEKTYIFKNLYTSELFVKEQYKEWFENEKLIIYW